MKSLQEYHKVCISNTSRCSLTGHGRLRIIYLKESQYKSVLKLESFQVRKQAVRFSPTGKRENTISEVLLTSLIKNTSVLSFFFFFLIFKNISDHVFSG